MNRITEHEVLDLLPSGNGMIFYYPFSVDDSQMTVAFKRISFDNGRVTNVAANIYQLAKFGTNYKAFCSEVENYLTCKAIVFPSEQILVIEADGTTKVLDSNGCVIWTGTLKYKGNAPSSVAVHSNKLWASYKYENVLVRYSLNTMREELRIGGGSASPFLEPDGLTVEGDYAYVCNPGSLQILKVDLNNYGLSVYKEFTMQPKQYYKIGNYEFVLMQNNALYMLD